MNNTRVCSVAYTTIKQLFGTIPSYYVTQGDGGYDLFAVGETISVHSRILGQTTDDVADFETYHKSTCVAAASADDAFVLGQVANNVPFVTRRLADGRARVSQEKSTGSRITFYTHNWCDPTTWYTSSKLVVTESISLVSGTYQLAHANVIDTYHGKLTGEDFLKDPAGNSYRIALSAAGYPKAEQDPHYNAGGDYVVDYDRGLITPLSGTFASPVTVTYHYATDSYFYVKPNPGKNLVIAQAEVQFSLDVGVADSVSFQPIGLVECWAPQLLGMIPSGTLIPLGNPVRYKTMLDFLNESQRSYPPYPAFGGSGWRGASDANIVMDWDYVSAQTIYSSTGMQIRIGLDHHQKFSGSFATATFYCTSEDP